MRPPWLTKKMPENVQEVSDGQEMDEFIVTAISFEIIWVFVSGYKLWFQCFLNVLVDSP